jgi:hypothetical protein
MSRPVPRRRKEERNGIGYFISLGITMSVILSVVALTIALQPEAEAKVIEPYLVVEDVYFVVDDQVIYSSTEDKIITMSVYITNSGKKDASGVSVRAFAIDPDSNLGVDYNEQTIGMIPQDTTGETNIVLSVPQGKTYRIELLVFESGKIVVRGSGTIKLLGSSGTAGEDFKTDPANGVRGTENIDDSDGGSGLEAFADDEASGSIFAGFALGIAIIVIVVTVLVAAKASGNRSDDDIKITTQEGNGLNRRPIPAPNQNGMNAEEEPAPHKILWNQEA